MQKENTLKSVTKAPKSTKQTQENIVKAPKSTKQTDKLPVKFPQNTIQTYKNTTQSAQLDNLLREGLQEQASQYYVTEVQDRHLQDAFEQMHKNNVKNAQPKHLRIKKAMAAAIAAAVLVFGTISIAFSRSLRILLIYPTTNHIRIWKKQQRKWVCIFMRRNNLPTDIVFKEFIK